MAAKYGTPYFSNYVNSDMNPSDIRSMCCRLRLDLSELRRKNGGFFGSGDKTGSVQVTTVNLPRIGYLASDEADFYNRLDKMLDIAARSCKMKRTAIEKFMDAGLYPYTKHYLGSFNNHFSTIGVVGMNEACMNAKWLRCDISNPKGTQFAKDVLNHIRERLVDYQVKYGDLYNLEATPAESTSYRFAKHDKEKYPDIITASRNENDTPYYTNSSHLPVWYTDDVFSALDIQDELQTLYTSGTVFHAFLGEKMPNWQSAAALVRKIAENYKLPYFTLSPTYSVCADHGYLTGETNTCPHCGKPTEIYSRITGYYRPVQNWNDGKAHEFRDRVTYDVMGHMTAIPRGEDMAHNETECSACKIPEQETESTSTIDAVAPDTQSSIDGKIILFATKTCPNCKVAASFLDKANVPYEKLYADEHPEIATQFNIKSAPTLIDARGTQVILYTNASNIRKFTDEYRNSTI